MDMDLATPRKRTDSTTLKENLPARRCIICTEEDVHLLRPCRTCPSDYCQDCLVDMFIAALDDNTRMPPRCCHLIQVHTVVHHLTPDEAKAYRTKFEEWITPVKTYCPAPKCSAFIPERQLPAIDLTPRKSSTASLSSVLREVVEAVVRSPSARFFREETQIVKLPGYACAVKKPMHLSMIQLNVLGNIYKSTSELTTDMQLIVANSTKHKGADHPVAKAADAMFAKYLSALATVTDRLATAPATSLPPRFFPCPSCHIAICTKCKQIEHAGTPCNTSQFDHEIAMLAQYGYKRCPRCKAGVKKMYGCSHMQCICGAHWCYYCQRSVSECDGLCEAHAREDDEDEEEEYYSDEDEGESEPGRRLHSATGQSLIVTAILDSPTEQTRVGSSATTLASTMPTNSTALSNPPFVLPRPQGRMSPPARPSTAPATATTAPLATCNQAVTPSPAVASTAPQASRSATDDGTTVLFRGPAGVSLPAAPSSVPTFQLPAADGRIVDLDAGGDRRWAEGDFNFGEEPEEGYVAQVWSCRHEFISFKPPPVDGIDHGDFTRMECNRCFERVEVSKEAPKRSKDGPRKRRKYLSVAGARLVAAVPEARDESQDDLMNSVPFENEAYECKKCRVLVCTGCKAKYLKERLVL